MKCIKADEDGKELFVFMQLNGEAPKEEEGRCASKLTKVKMDLYLLCSPAADCEGPERGGSRPNAGADLLRASLA